MTKQKVKKQQERKPFLSGLYECVEYLPSGIGALLFMASFLCVAIYWVMMPESASTLHGFNPWLMFTVFIILSELLFMWIVDNEASNGVDMDDTIAYKMMAIVISLFLTIWGFTIVSLIRDYLSIEVLQEILSFFGIGLLVIGGTILFFKLNHLLAKAITKNKKSYNYKGSYLMK